MLGRKETLSVVLVCLLWVSGACGADNDDLDDGSSEEESFRMPSVLEGHDFTEIADGAGYMGGHLLVRFAPGVNGQAPSVAEKEQILSEAGGGTLERNYKVVAGLSLVKLAEGLTVEAGLKRFNKVKEILYAEPDYEIYLAGTFPNDPNFDDLWGMHNTGQIGGTVDADIDAPEAWDTITDCNIIVAVLDTGVDYDHVDLAGNMWVNQAEADGNPGEDDDNNGYVDDIYGWDFADNDNNPMDYSDHGTHCSGTIGAVGDNNEGVAGVCWDVKIMALKILPNYGEEAFISGAIGAVEYGVDKGAKVMSNSWHHDIEYSQSMKDVIEVAGQAGILFVAAAGNDEQDNDIFPTYPASYDSDNIIAVMATDANDKRSVWSQWDSSSYGATTVDLAAPGSNILSCKIGDGYRWWGGTSMATPHVAGACALLWSQHPTSTYYQIKDTFVYCDTVDKKVWLENDPNLGRLCVSGGRLNIYNALLRHGERVCNLNNNTWYSTIQSAIDDASQGDEIVVHRGTYNGAIDFDGKSLTLRSYEPTDWGWVSATVIDGDGANAVVNLGANCELRGFTIRDGEHGVYCSSEATIRNCVIEDCNSNGVYCANSVLITNNMIKQNGGDGIYCWGSVTPTIKNNLICKNSGDGLEFSTGTLGTLVRNNTIADNNGCGISVTFGAVTNISNCIFWGNDGNDLENCSATYSCIEDGDGGAGNISYDPNFIDASGGNYRLMASSACVNAGNANDDYSGETDIDSRHRVVQGAVDIGAHEVFRYVHNTEQDKWYEYIQDAINGANNGEVIEVYEGLFNEQVSFKGKAVTLCSTDPNDWDVVAATIIDANGLAQPGVVFTFGEDANSVLSGFTIQNSTYSQGGIQCGSASVSDCDATISNCIITSNKVGVYCARSSPTIRNNIISGNVDSGVHCISAGATPVIENNWIYRTISDDPEQGGGIGIDEGSGIVTVRNNTIVGNLCGIWSYKAAEPNIVNCIVWNNFYEDLWHDSGTLTAKYSCIKDSFDSNDPNYEGSINADPYFVNGFGFIDMTNGNGTQNTIIVADADLYEVDDVIEYDDDGVVRTVTDVSTNSNTVTFGPALGSDSVPGVSIYNWGAGVTDVNEDFHLDPDSVCIDAGDPNYSNDANGTDLDGRPRIIDGDGDGTAVVDMGVYEFDPNYVDPGSTLVYVDSDIPVVGTVSGNFDDTHTSDNVYESITEVESGGQSPNRRYSYLEHKWTVDMPSVDTATFQVEAYHTVNNEGDDFIFAYSIDDSVYIDMVTVTKTIDDDIAQGYEVPNDVSGTVYIRVKDSDQTSGSNSLDAVYIDEMYILCEGVGEPTYGVTITESNGSTDVDEEGPTSDTYTVVLDSQPAETVSITVDPDVETEVNSNGAGNPVQLLFLTTNWDVPQTVTVTAIDDSDVEGPHTSTITHISTSSDANYNGIAISDLVANVTDNDSGCSASTMYVGSIVCESVGSKGMRYGQVTVSIYDNCGGGVADADVTGTFTGDFNETLTETTDGNGVAVIRTTTTQSQRPSYEFCVDDVSHGILVYDPNNNVETCDSY
ncbi:MAG: S8 family serine peptidase [Planctomycetota bacterium]|nr:MAG: S8 family serine peptidase [Planctomycetota bacterium]